MKEDEALTKDSVGETQKHKEVYVSPELKKFPPIRVATGYTYYYYYYSYSYSS